MDKLISVVIPTYNRKKLTDEAIESVVTTYPEVIEIVVVDDSGSTAYTYDSAVNSSGASVRVIRLPENGGAGMARKAGVKCATGEYIAFLDSDDRYNKKWMDWVVEEVSDVPLDNGLIIISGVCTGERKVGAIARRMIASFPGNYGMLAARLVAILFNPFYTPSLVMSRKLCQFKTNLRHCEDYYSTVAALFMADRLHLPNALACHLGREPNSQGGESSESERMFAGEMTVRKEMLFGTILPFYYKGLVPLGIAYQYLRSGIKRLVRLKSEE